MLNKRLWFYNLSTENCRVSVSLFSTKGRIKDQRSFLYGEFNVSESFQISVEQENIRKKEIVSQKERLHFCRQQLLFLGGIGIKTEIKTKAAKLRRQRDS